MILARLLAKEDFGLMAIIFVVAQLLEASTDAGVQPSIIQNKRGGEPAYLNVAWWFQAVRGLSLFAVAFFLAPLICQFYNVPELLGWLRFSFLAVVFNGLLSPRAYALQKNFQFGRVAFLMQGGSFLGIVLTILLAFVLRDVSALVIGYTAEPALRTLISYILCPLRPSLKIDRDKLKSLFTFARGAFGLPILTCIAFQMDLVVLGKMVTKPELGMYYVAAGFMQLPIELFRKVIGGFLLPAFAEKQDEQHTLYKGLLEMTRNTALLCMPPIVFLAVCAGPVLSVVFGAAFSAAAIPFGILSCYVLARVQSHILGLIFLAVGKPHIQRRCALIRLIIILALIYPAVFLFGLSGAAMALLLSNSATLAAQVIWMRKTIKLRFIDYARCYQLGLSLAMIVFIPTVLLRLLGAEAIVLNIIVGCASCLAAYMIGLLLTAKTKQQMNYVLRETSHPT
jgi:O-antigen/teichoic acid export membrane protein